MVATITGLHATLSEPTRTPIPPTPTPSAAGHDIGVIVTKFVVTPAQNIDVAEADELVEQFSNRLEPELRESLQQLGLSLGYLRPDEVGRIAGDTLEEREDSARDFARAHGADIVVYGVLSRNSTTHQVEIEPEYYVGPKSFSDAYEVTGSFRFGDEIGLDEPINRAFETEGALSSRTMALAHVVIGLSKYMLEDYQGARQSFSTAAELPGWEETAGREVLYVLLGNAYLKLGQQSAMRCERSEVIKQIDLAKDEYNQASQLAPEYSRPYAGLASASYLAALWSPEENEGCTEQLVDLDLLDAALEFVDQALAVEDQPSEIGVRSKVLLTRAQALFFKWNTEDVYSPTEYDKLYKDFLKATNQIIRNYEEGDNPSVALLAIEAYGLRGMAQYLRGIYRSAIAEYSSALVIEAIPPTRRMFFVGWMGDCYDQLGQFAKAAELYDEALQIAQAIQNDDAIAYYTDLRDSEDRKVRSASS